MFEPILNESILGRATEKGILEFNLINIRDFTLDKHKSVDDTPYGGGAGMIMSAQPLFHALDSIDAESKKILYLSPRGHVIDKDKIDSLAMLDEITLICGHYEGIDERVIENYDVEEISIGDYILTGGELPAMVLIDTVCRMVPGVIGSHDSHLEESIYSGLIEYPQFTKPRVYQDMEVPEVLVSGHHKNIQLWNLDKSLRLTAERRPDLFEKFIGDHKTFSKEEKAVVRKVLKDYNYNIEV
jgi:tRNA (guanine37-N1)-methyltransferase